MSLLRAVLPLSLPLATLATPACSTDDSAKSIQDVRDGGSSSGGAFVQAGGGGSGGASASGVGGVVSAGGVSGASDGSATCSMTLCSNQCVDLNTDSDHCGGCSIQCLTGMACHGTFGAAPADPPSTWCCTGTCEPIASLGGYPIALGGGNIHWLTWDGQDGPVDVMRMPVSGGAPTKLASLPTGEGSIAVDRTSVYVAGNSAYPVDGGFPGTIWKVPLDGSPTVTLATGANVRHVAVGATMVYFTRGDSVMQVPIGGGTPSPLVSGLSWPDTLVVDATNVYFTDSADGKILKVPLAGGSPTTLASGQNGPTDIAVDAANVYWTRSESVTGGDLIRVQVGAVMQVPIGGGTPTAITQGQSEPTGIAVDTSNLYWIDNGAGPGATLYKAPLAGGTPIALATGPLRRAGGIAVDATNIYAAGEILVRLPLH